MGAFAAAVQASQLRGTNFLQAMAQHSSLIHPHPATPTHLQGPSENCRTCLEKMQNFPPSLKINQPRTHSPFILSYHHPGPIIAKRVPFELCSLCLFYRTTIFSPRHLPLLLKVILGANLSSKCRVPEIFEPRTATVIVCLNFKPLLLCLCGECSCELPPPPASKVSKDLQSVTRSGIKISQKTVRTRRRFTTLCVSLSFCRWVPFVELSEKAAESFCRS